MKNYQSDQKTNNKSDCMHINLQNLIISNTGIMDQESDSSEKSKLGRTRALQTRRRQCGGQSRRVIFLKFLNLFTVRGENL